jgi:hypothetical protein
MFGKALEVSDLKVSASIDGGIEIPMAQVSSVVVTCIMDGDAVVRVHADQGIEFASDGGLLTMSYMRCADITSICDRKAMAKKLRAIAEEGDAIKIHVTSVKGEF